MELDFFSQSGFGRSRAIDPSRMINFFAEISRNPNAKSRASMIGTPGTSLALSAGTGTIRSLYNFGGSLYAISGNELYYIAPNLTATALGSINTTSGPVSIDDNGLYSAGEGGNQMIIVDGTSGYIYNPTLSSNNFSVINSPGFPANPSAVCFMDTYFIATNDTMGLWTSANYDGTTWYAIAEAFAEATSDSIAAPVNLNDQLLIMKGTSSQAWYDASIAPAQGSPFLPVPGAVGTYGATAPGTVCSTNGGIFFLGTQSAQGGLSGVIQMAAYNSEQIISPPAITYRISQLPKIADAFSYTFDMEGHTFYVTTFPSSNWTLCYDISTQRWFEWSTYDPSRDPDEVGRHLGNCYSFAYGKHWVGDYRNGNIYNLSSSTYTDAGQPIISTWISDLYSDKQALTNIIYHELEIAAEVGYGDPTKGGPPVAELSWSNDAGEKFTTPYPVSMGFIGQYSKRLRWRRLGRGTNRVWKFRCAEPIRKCFVSAIMRVS